MKKTIKILFTTLILAAFSITPAFADTIYQIKGYQCMDGSKPIMPKKMRMGRLVRFTDGQIESIRNGENEDIRYFRGNIDNLYLIRKINEQDVNQKTQVSTCPLGVTILVSMQKFDLNRVSKKTNRKPEILDL